MENMTAEKPELAIIAVMIKRREDFIYIRADKERIKRFRDVLSCIEDEKGFSPHFFLFETAMDKIVALNIKSVQHFCILPDEPDETLREGYYGNENNNNFLVMLTEVPGYVEVPVESPEIIWDFFCRLDVVSPDEFGFIGAADEEGSADSWFSIPEIEYAEASLNSYKLGFQYGLAAAEEGL